MADTRAIDDATDAAHGGLMDAIYRNQRHVYDLTRKYYLLGRDRVIDGLNVPLGGKVLETACGTGRNLIVAARRYPDARFYGLDISEEMLKQARKNIARAGLQNRIIVARANATDFDPAELFGVVEFDRAFISYGLSMIPPWREAVVEAMRHLKPEGSLHVVDFGQQDDLPGWFRGLLTAWLTRFHVHPRPDLEEALHAAGSQVRFEYLYRDYARLGIVRA